MSGAVANAVARGGTCWADVGTARMTLARASDNPMKRFIGASVKTEAKFRGGNSNPWLGSPGWLARLPRRWVTTAARRLERTACVEQPAGRTKEKRQHEARQHQDVRDAALPRVAHFPVADQQIERQVVSPTRQQDPRVAEQRRPPRGATKSRLRSLTSWLATSATYTRARIAGTTFTRDGEWCTRGSLGDSTQQHPGPKRNEVQNVERLIRGHGLIQFSVASASGLADR